MELCLLLNDAVIFTMKTEAQEVAITLNNGESEGVFLMLETPEKVSRCLVFCCNIDVVEISSYYFCPGPLQ